MHNCRHRKLMKLKLLWYINQWTIKQMQQPNENQSEMRD
jgi:hypothetical protein